MYFDSIKDLLLMDGHGVFVWTCYLVCFISLGFFAVQTALEQRAIKQQIRQDMRRESRRSNQ